MRVLVTGTSGLLGTWLRSTAPPAVDVVAVAHRRPIDDAWPVVLDLRDRAAVVAALRASRPQVVIHAAYAKDERSIVDATHHLAAAAHGVGAEFVQVSSEAVFAGDGSVRGEADRPDPVWDYGKWKAEAEGAATDGCPGAAIVRLPLIISVDPPDHIATAIRAGADGEPPTWYTDEMRQPAMAEDLAIALWAIATLPPVERAGVWHLPGPELLSRLEIAQRTVDALGLDPGLLVGTPTPAGARRPKDIRMSAERATATIDWDPRPIHT